MLRPVLSPRQRLQLRGMLLLWCCTLAAFWAWWLDPTHIVDVTTYIVSTVTIGWWLFLPGYYFFFLSRMRQPDRSLPIPTDLRVAMVTTKAPSEPFPVVEATLLAMLAQQHRHDTWLADEDPTDETLAWCAAHGVQVSTRRGIAAYHQPTWPRRARCKEGNLAFFYDTYGYAAYEVVVQLDADHRPEPGYLEAMLRPFADPAVGYVSAPSICDGNALESWAARARLNAEATLHGSLQAGYNAGWAPLCIGSHYAVRTRALQQIGGLGPELAEDHSTALLLNAAGWRGVHALDAQARGDGPRTFADCMTQEFQWARSLVVLLLTVTPRCWAGLSMRLRAQFLFTQLWYPLFGSMMLVSYLIPIAALASGRPWVNASYPTFVLLAGLSGGSALIIVAWSRAGGWLRPPDVPLISWETIVYQLARWPWVLLGSLAAILDVATRKPFIFRVTPKGTGALPPLPARALVPYIALATLSALAALTVSDAGAASGYYYFAMVDSCLYALVASVVVGMHLWETSRA